ncbi:L,D-transpeptidase family protein [Rubritalea marina]|uniref:L,D-transpeptidase family protein n=1 Tax=Rubritalea marina TaxID=361055 RepID=UPI0014613466|nr:L,D-transpeptidase family protein [Rubritalea marina]
MKLLKPLMISAALLSGALLSSCATTTQQTKLAPGQFEWHPERSPSGPVLMVVSIDDQMAYVYRNGVQIARSTVSTGRAGKETPTGVFQILQRKVDHESNVYKGAKMPYMQRLTWTGIAMHAGQLPGYPASGGCIRLPYEFSQKVYGVLSNGSTVAITKKGTVPSYSAKPANVLMASKAKSSSNQAVPDMQGRVIWEPGKSRSGPYSVLLSYADRTAYVWRNGIKIGQSPFAIASGTRPPEGVFIKLENGDGPRSWSVLSLKKSRVSGSPAEQIANSIQFPAEFTRKTRGILSPGTILLATAEASNASTMSKRDFGIIQPDKQ